MSVGDYETVIDLSGWEQRIEQISCDEAGCPQADRGGCGWAHWEPVAPRRPAVDMKPSVRR